MQDKRTKPGYGHFLRALLALAFFAALIPFAARWKAQENFGSTPVRAEQPFSYSINLPITISSNPRLVLERGRLREMKAAPFTAARRTLILERALFRLDTSASAIDKGSASEPGGAPAALIMPLIAAWKIKGYDTLKISRSGIILSGAPGAIPKKIRRLEATIKAGRNGLISAKGGFRYRGQDVTFDGSVTAAKTATADRPLPFSFKVESPALDSRFKYNGTLSFAGGLALAGDTTLMSGDLRRALQWLTGNFPAGNGLKFFEAQGQCELNGAIFSCQEATIHLDDNVVAGGLSLNLGKARPAINGTLAARTALDLTHYLAPAATGIAANAALDIGPALNRKPGAGHAASLADYDLTMPLIKRFDADIRLSAATVRLNGFEMRDAAAAISLRAGKLLADIAEVKLEFGRASGQISADMNGGIPHYGLRGRFETTDISPIMGRLIGTNVLAGRATLVLDLEGAGRTAGQMVQALSGKGHFALPDGGSIGFDPRALISGAAKGDFKGWGSNGGRMSLKTADAAFTIRNGVINTHSMEAQSADLEICCQEGEVDFIRKTLDLKLWLSRARAENSSDTAPSPAHCRKKAQEAVVLRLQGRWHSPNIRLQRPANKTDMTQPIGPGNG